MFDIGFWELAVIGAIMLLVLGPERLPGVARTCGFWLSKLRRTMNDVKAEIKREMDAAELKEIEDVKDQINKAHQQLNQNIDKEFKQTNPIDSRTKDEPLDGEQLADKNEPDKQR